MNIPIKYKKVTYTDDDPVWIDGILVQIQTIHIGGPCISTLYTIIDRDNIATYRDIDVNIKLNERLHNES